VNEDIKDGLKIGALGLAAIVVGFLLLIAVSSMAIFGWGFFQRSTANFRGQTAAIEKTKANADFRIQSYQKFFNLCGEIQAKEDQARIFQAQLDADKRAGINNPDHQTNLNAVLATRASLVREYNNLATRGFTEGQFRDSNLPYQININNMETQCA